MNLIIDIILKIFEAIFEQEASATAGKKPANAPKPSVPPIPRGQRARRPPEPVHKESLEEHILKVEAHQRDLEDHHELQAAPEIRPTLVKIPGKTPLEQMIYAGVILGPCKARHGGRRLL